MTKPTSNSLTFYPAYCHKASPIHFSWVKLRAFDIHHALTTQPGFDGQNLYFYLNHPVQFVCLVGIIVIFEEFYEKRWLFTLDDSSGETIEIVCPKPLIGHDVGGRRDPVQEPDADVVNRERVMLQVNLGSVVKIKGTISVFRDIRQISLERIGILDDTNAEAEFWQQRAKLFKDVLSKPWLLSIQQQKALLKNFRDRNAQLAIRAAKRREHDAIRAAREGRHEEKIARRYAKEEIQRAHGAQEAKQAAITLQQGKVRRPLDALGISPSTGGT